MMLLKDFGPILTDFFKKIRLAEKFPANFRLTKIQLIFGCKNTARGSELL